MTLANLTSPMNPEHLNAPVITAPAGPGAAPAPALLGALPGGAPPGL